MASLWILLCVSLFSSCFANNNSQPPNIIVMLMDDMGWGDLGSNGNPVKETPNIDKMASEGLVFNNFYVASPLCSPSRASLLTGRLPIRNGFYSTNARARNSYVPQEMAGGISKSEILITQLLEKAGYRNKIVGKWHLGHAKAEYHPLRHGFQEYFGTPNCHFGPYDNRNTPNIPVFKNENMIGRYFENIFIDRKRQISNLTEIQTNEAIEFIETQASSGTPFFLYWTPDTLHAPTIRSSKFVGKSLKGSSYGDALMEIDHSVGQILDTIRRNVNISTNTLVFFTSDNGAALVSKTDAGTNSPFLCGKQTTFEGGFREPGIAWWPSRINGSRTTSHVSSTMDLFKTFANLAGVEVPSDRIYDSEDLTPIMFKESKQPSGSPIFFYRGDTMMALRVGAYKAHFWTFTTPWAELKRGIDFCPGAYIANVTTPSLTRHKTPILFHLERDPSERYPIPSWTDEYRQVIGTIFDVQREHNANLKPGKPVLNVCDRAAMNWAPQGCQAVGMCLPVPESKPYKCDWPH